jgi:NADH-quinone oxidoreductase subunit F
VQGLIRHFRHEIESRIDAYSRNAEKGGKTVLEAAE